MKNEPTAVFVHGAWHNGWSWHLVRELLDDRGIASIAPDFPMVTLDADAAVLRSTLDDLDGDAVIVGHSWGGSVVTLGASGSARAKHLIYVCAVLTEIGCPVQTSFESPNSSEWTRRREQLIKIEGDRATLEPSGCVAALYHDVDPVLAAEAIGQLRPFYMSGYRTVETDRPAAWSIIPTTYAICTDDQMIEPIHQREMARRAGDIVEWDSSHSPFLSHPELIADLVAEKVSALRASGQSSE